MAERSDPGQPDRLVVGMHVGSRDELMQVGNESGVAVHRLDLEGRVDRERAENASGELGVVYVPPLPQIEVRRAHREQHEGRPVRPLGRGYLVLVELVAVRQGEDLVLDDERGAVWPVEHEIHVTSLALYEPTRVRAGRGERPERRIGRVRKLVEEPTDEIGVEQLALAVHEPPERIRFDAAGDVFGVLSHDESGVTGAESR